jgi:hypothetical protein
MKIKAISCLLATESLLLSGHLVSTTTTPAAASAKSSFIYTMI